MNVKFKYFSIHLNVLLMLIGTNSSYIVTRYMDKASSAGLRIKRQAGYVYDKPTVSFDLPTATSIATTQAPTVDRIQMQMYYAYPVPASGDTVSVSQQNIGSSAGSSTAVSSTANGYSYEVQNTQVADSGSATLTETQNTVNSGYQNAAVTGTQNTVNGGYQNTAVTGNQAVVSSGSTGYGDGRPTAISNTGATGGSISTSAPRYLPPKNSGENVGVTVTTSNQAQTGLTISKPSDSYIPPSIQVSSPQNDQRVTVTQSATNERSPPSNPNTGYLLPNPQSVPKVSVQPGPVQSVPSAPTQQYLPPIESSAGQKIIEGSVAAPASTYLPPVF